MTAVRFPWMPRSLYHRTSRHVKSLSMAAAVALGTLGVSACSLSDLVQNRYPPDVTPPDALENSVGAIAIYQGAIHAFRHGFASGQPYATGSFVVTSGLLSDELNTGAYDAGNVSTTLNFGTPAGISARRTDEGARNDPDDGTATGKEFVRAFNLARNQSSVAIAYLQKYAPSSAPNLVGNAYIIHGLTELYLADIFCSGVPFSEVGEKGGFHYEAGATTEQIYTDAIKQFDSALANIPDSLTYRYMAQVAKARALLNLGKFNEAAQAVNGVPTAGWRYLARYTNTYRGTGRDVNFTNLLIPGGAYNTNGSGTETYFGTVADREGGNGLPFVSSNDPRVPLTETMKHPTYPATQYWLPKWLVPVSAGGTSTRNWGGESLLVGNGVEARLVEAEVKAQANDASYLTILNTLRTTCIDAASCVSPAPAGTGGVANLLPLTDPGTQKDRVKQVFDERAYWLFLTGHRQGDLRRLVRVYQWPQDSVYPTGAFPIGESRSYGVYTNLPYPNQEQTINAKYNGCFNRDA